MAYFWYKTILSVCNFFCIQFFSNERKEPQIKSIINLERMHDLLCSLKEFSRIIGLLSYVRKKILRNYIYGWDYDKMIV